jgi:hypothetical protein
MIQEIAPAYQRARVDGLDHDAAVNRALADTGIAGAFGAVMGLAPGMSAFGREAEGALRRPISEALLQIFGVQPGIGTAQRVAEGAVEGKMPTAAELGTGYAENVGLGVALTGGHAALAGARAVGAARPPSDVAAVLDAGSVDEAAAHAANVAGTPGAVPAVPAEAVEPEPAAAAPAQETPAPLAIDADATARAQGFADAADMAATQRAGASVGAASSRDIPATAALADQLTPPQGRDDATYVPDVTRPEAMKDFGPAAPGEPMSASAEHKVLYNTDPDYKERFDAVVRENNGVMTHDLIDGLIGDANSRKAAMDEADKLMPGPVGLFHDQRPVDAQPIVDEINDILNGPKGKLDAVKTTLGRVLASLYDKNGQLETLPSMLKGVRDNINHKLYDNTPSDEGAAARNSRDQLKAVQSVVDGVISEGVPGTKYQDYLKNLSAALGQVDKLDFLQKYLTGPKQLTGPDGLLQLNKVQQMLKDIEAHHDDETGGAKQLTMPEINRIEAVRNELQAKDLLDRRMKVPGSPTVQIASGAGILGSGPLGMGIKRAGEAALHLGLFKTTGGLGNAALVGYRYGIQPAMEARSAARAAAEMAARKERLLDTTPRVTEAGEPIPLPALPPRPPPRRRRHPRAGR